jgi:hypothetical protein
MKNRAGEGQRRRKRRTERGREGRETDTEKK